MRGGGEGGELVLGYDVGGEPGVPQRVQASLSSARPHGLAVREECALEAGDLACVPPDKTVVLEVVAMAGERLHLVVEAAFEADETDFQLQISREPELP